MKYILIFAIVSNLFSNQLFEKLDKLIKNKKEKSVVILDYDPFQTNTENKSGKIIKNVQKIKKIYKLVTILNNKAFINGKWYRKNDKIDDFLIKHIDNKKVFLVSKSKKLILTLKDNKRIIHIRNR